MYSFNPLNTGGLFHCYMLDKSICHFRRVGSISSLSFYFQWKILLANNVGPDQMPHYVASDLGLHCLPIDALHRFPGKNGLRKMAGKNKPLKVQCNLSKTATHRIALKWLLHGGDRNGEVKHIVKLHFGNFKNWLL